MPLRSLAILLLAFSFTACASAPPAASPGAPPGSAKPAAAASLRTVDLLCAEGARYVSFDKIGVPSGESPTGIALTHGNVWVLFPQRLVRIGRGGEHVDVAMQVAPVEERWVAIAVDPLDESLWIASETRLGLYKVWPDGHMSTVKLQHKVEGVGGFSGLIVGRDSIYVQPTCADKAVWRLDRSGKLLGTALEAPKKTESDEPVVLRTGEPRRDCYSVRLEREADGRIVAWDAKARATWQVDDQGVWTRSDSHLFAAAGEPSGTVALKGLDIGEKNEQWYFANGLGSLFYWKGKPVFVRSRTMKERAKGNDTVLYVPGGQELIMPCHGVSLWNVATDATGYAAITDRFLVLGEMASAPDLP
jgi:hypothetical protein